MGGVYCALSSQRFWRVHSRLSNTLCAQQLWGLDNIETNLEAVQRRVSMCVALRVNNRLNGKKIIPERSSPIKIK